jgi:hypothetical protein
MVGAGRNIMVRFVTSALRTISAAALIVLAIAVTPTVAKALVHSHPTIADGAKLNETAADQSCAAFETWFLDPACSNVHDKKAARTKHHLARK